MSPQLTVKFSAWSRDQWWSTKKVDGENWSPRVPTGSGETTQVSTATTSTTTCPLWSSPVVVGDVTLHSLHTYLQTSWFSGVLCCIVQVVVEYFAANEWRCLLVAWLRQVGFIVVYGSLVLKIYRSVQRTGPTGPQRLLCMMPYGNRSSSSADRVGRDYGDFSPPSTDCWRRPRRVVHGLGWPTGWVGSGWAGDVSAYYGLFTSLATDQCGHWS